MQWCLQGSGSYPCGLYGIKSSRNCPENKWWEMPRWAAEGKGSSWHHLIWQDSLSLGTSVICSPDSLWSLGFISAQCHGASTRPVVLVKHWAQEGKSLAAQRIRKHRLSCPRRMASKHCSSVYSSDNRIKAIRLINVMLSESRISPPMEKQKNS